MIVKNKFYIILVFVLFIFLILPFSFAFNDNNTTELGIDGSNHDMLTANDYYFNASVEDDGNGSQNNPYKYISKDKLVENSVIYLSDGEYELDKGKTVYNISIIGQSSQNTIINFQNNNSILTAMGNLTLMNVTLVDVTIVNYGNLNATNINFKDSIAYIKNTESTNLVNSASNAFGGAIYCPDYQYRDANVNLDNCTFINNTAEYGGAIYMYGGSLIVKNSIFLDNYAYNYGGAIAGEYNSRMNIEKSKFINSKSLNDAGWI